MEGPNIVKSAVGWSYGGQLKKTKRRASKELEQLAEKEKGVKRQDEKKATRVEGKKKK